VKGWPGGKAWINTSTLFVRYNTCVWMAGGSDRVTIGGGRPGREQTRTIRAASGFQTDAPKGEPNEIVDAWVAKLIQRPIESQKRDVLIQAIGEKPTDESVKKMVQLIVSMPDYQLC
jgi:hypothetical protein